MNQYKKLINNSFIFAIGNLGSKVIMFVMLPLYTYKLSTAEYGTVDLIITTVSLLLPIVSLSVFDAVLRFSMDREVNIERLFTNSMFVTNIGALVLTIVSGILFFIDKSWFFLPVLLCLQSYQSLFSQYAKGVGKVKLFSINGILLSFLTAGLNVIFLIPLDMGLQGYLISYCIAFLISDIYLYSKLKLKYEYHKEMIKKEYISRILKFSIPLIPNSIAWWVTTAVGRYFILFFIGASSNGIFAVANKIPALLTVFTSIFAQSWQISAIEEFNSKNRKVFFDNVYNAYGELLVIGCSGILFIIKPVFKIMATGDFFIAWKYAPLLLISIIFSCLSAFLGSQYIAAKDTISVLKTTILGALLNVIFNFIFVPTLGLNGVGIASLLSFLIVWLIREKDLQKYFEVSLNKRKLLISMLLMFCQVFILNILAESLISYLLNFSILLMIIFLNRSIFQKILHKK